MLRKVLLSVMAMSCMLFMSIQALAAQGFPYVPDAHTVFLLHLDEVTADGKVIDDSKNHFDGLVEGKIKLGEEGWKREGGGPGKAFIFDGQTCVNFGRPFEILSECQDAMTVEAWVYPELLSGWNLILTCWGSTRDGGPLHLASDAGFPDILIDTGTDAAMDPQGWMKITAFGKPFELREWQHVAATYDSKEGGRLYVNGELVGEKVHKGKIWVSGGKGRDLVLGARNERVLNWIGMIDEVRISSVAREPGELSPNLRVAQVVSSVGKLAAKWGTIKNR